MFLFGIEILISETTRSSTNVVLRNTRPKIPNQTAMSAPTEKKSWKQVHQESKDQKKKYRDANMVKKLEKQRRKEEAKQAAQAQIEQEELERPKLVSTISIAVPGSIMDNAQSAELRTYLAGQIARAACVYRVDEVIVFDDYGSNGPSESKKSRSDTTGEDGQTIHHCCLQLARILQYLECPQYLRKFFFPIHKDLKFSGLLNPLDAPHHLRQQNDFIFREGVVQNKPVKETKGSYVNIGLLNDCMVDKVLTPGIRVTVKLEPNQDLRSRKIKATVVSPSLPRAETGVYWGYTVRVASCLSEVFTKSPYDEGYDLTIGTSDKGDNVHSLEKQSLRFNHALIVYGGLQGLESALESDDKLTVDDPSLLFNEYVNTIPGQGSRTIRTEEAILISLAALEDKLDPVQRPKEFILSESIPQSEDTGVRQFEPRRKEKEPIKEATDENDGQVASVATNRKGTNDLSRFD